MLDTPQACTGFGTRAVGAPGPEGPLVMGAPSAVTVWQFSALLLSRYSSLPESAWLAPTCGAGCIIASILQVRTLRLNKVMSLTQGSPLPSGNGSKGA